MQTLFFVIFIGLIGGLAIGIQAPMANFMSDKIGILESSFFVHAGGAVVAAIPLLFLRGGKLGEWHSVPWYVLWAGALGLVLISTINYTIPRIGVAGGIMLLIIGQLTMAIAIDHFGWLEAEIRSFNLSRGLGILVMMVGVWLVIR
jgi:transporter family-2 protein